MKFRYLPEVEAPVRSYAGLMVSTGDIIELDGDLAEKAKRNPEYEQLKRGRPRGDKGGSKGPGGN